MKPGLAFRHGPGFGSRPSDAARPDRHRAFVRARTSAHDRRVHGLRFAGSAPCAHHPGRTSARSRMDRSAQPDPRRRGRDREPVRDRGPDARGDARDRGVEPPLFRGRRGFHDRLAGLRAGRGAPRLRARHLHPRRTADHHAALHRSALVPDLFQQAVSRREQRRRQRLLPPDAALRTAARTAQALAHAGTDGRFDRDWPA